MFLRKPARRAIPPIITFWNWLLNLSIYLLLIALVMNLDEFRLLGQLAGGVSVFESAWLLLVTAVAVLFASGAVHELGHLLAGKWVGFRFHLLVIGPLKIQRKRDGLRVQWQWSNSLFSGLTACLPENDDRLRWRMLAFAAGGPLASVVLAGVSAFVFFHYRRDFAFLREMGWVVEVAAAAAVASLIFFFSSMKPGLYHTGLPADGGRIASLLQGDKMAERWCTLVMLNGVDALGLRPRDWDAALVYKAMTLADGTHDDLSARILGYQWALDSGRLDMAWRLLDEALENWAAWMSGARISLTLEKAYFLAHHRRNVDDARHWFEQVRQRRGIRPLQQRAEAAILLAEGKYEAAQALAASGLATLQQEVPTGMVLAESDWCRDILQRAQLP
ncbi:MAG: hypothetical protein H6658_12855 [Ardenticatenaceae bacterium]|nr:hypothetical protein [Ardenticatenaceae bacterium]